MFIQHRPIWKRFLSRSFDYLMVGDAQQTECPLTFLRSLGVQKPERWIMDYPLLKHVPVVRARYCILQKMFGQEYNIPSMVQRFPRLLTSRPETLKSKADALSAALPLHVPLLLQRDPLILFSSVATVLGKYQALRVLVPQCDPARLIAIAPTLLRSASSKGITHKIEVIKTMFPNSDLTKMITNCPQLLTMMDITLLTNFNLLKEMFPGADVTRIVEQAPTLLCCDVDYHIRAKVEMLGQLLPTTNIVKMIEHFPGFLRYSIGVYLRILFAKTHNTPPTQARPVCPKPPGARAKELTSRVKEYEGPKFYLKSGYHTRCATPLTLVVYSKQRFQSLFPEYHGFLVKHLTPLAMDQSGTIMRYFSVPRAALSVDDVLRITKPAKKNRGKAQADIEEDTSNSKKKSDAADKWMWLHNEHDVAQALQILDIKQLETLASMLMVTRKVIHPHQTSLQTHRALRAQNDQ